MNIVEDFFGAARTRLEEKLAPISGSGQSSLGSQIFEAIYQYGKGRTEVARDKLVASFLGTSEGQKIQASATKQTLAQYLPYIIVGVVGLLLLGFAVGKR